MTLSHDEFLRRFLQHILPRGFPSHSLLRVARQPPPRKAPSAVSQPAGRSTCTDSNKAARGAASRSLPSLSGTDADRRAVDFRSTSTESNRRLERLDTS
jgi:hypothetical protein